MAHHNKILNLHNWKGKYFTVISKEPIANKHGLKTLWLCLCNCGKEFYEDGSRIKCGRRKSCGCLKRGYKVYYRHINAQDCTWFRLIESYKKHAFKRDLVFELSEAKFKELCLGNCFYCFKKPTNILSGYGKLSPRGEEGKIIYNGVDRIDSNIGYIENNCRSCCKNCNTLKSNMSEADFAEQVRKIYEHFIKISS